MKSMVKLLVVGMDSFLGETLTARFTQAGVPWIGTSRRESSRPDGEILHLDLSDPASIASLDLFGKGITHALICAAVPRLDLCERDPEKTRNINVLGTIQLLDILNDADIVPVFFSSDYVFDDQGDPNPTEDTPCSPTSTYGAQKRETELAILRRFDQYLIFRSSKIFAVGKDQRNPLTQMLSQLAQGKTVDCAFDQMITPVLADDIATAVLAGIRQNKSGIYHLAMDRKYSRSDLGLLLAESFHFPKDLIRSRSYADIVGVVSGRRLNSVLKSAKVNRDLGVRLRNIEDVLSDLKQTHGGGGIS